MQSNLYKYATSYTLALLAGKKNAAPSMWNGKPYRTQRQKAEARRTCRKAEDGSYFSNEPVHYHPMSRRTGVE